MSGVWGLQALYRGSSQVNASVIVTQRHTVSRLPVSRLHKVFLKTYKPLANTSPCKYLVFIPSKTTFPAEQPDLLSKLCSLLLSFRTGREQQRAPPSGEVWALHYTGPLITQSVLLQS